MFEEQDYDISYTLENSWERMKPVLAQTELISLKMFSTEHEIIKFNSEAIQFKSSREMVVLYLSIACFWKVLS